MSTSTPDWDGPQVPAFDPLMHRAKVDLRDAALDGRERPVWRPAADLPVPEPQPGFAFRWVRVSNNNVMDVRNVSRRLSEGWEPVPATDQPNMLRRIGRLGVNGEGNIEVGGLLLCRLPEELKNARNAYYNNAAMAQVRAVDGAYLREQDPRMPKLAPERSTTVSTSGRN